MRAHIVVVFIISMSATALGCTCMGAFQAKNMREVAEWYVKQEGIGLIFQGKVIKQELSSGLASAPDNAMSMTGSTRFRKVTFATSRVFRGDSRDQIAVATGLGTGDCGFDFQTGQEYLVYANATSSGSWFTSICSGTSQVEDAATAVRLLRGESPTAEDLMSPEQYRQHYLTAVLPKRTGSICGRVTKPDSTPLKGAVVELWELRNDEFPSRMADDPNTSSDDGDFCIENALPGRYLLTAEDEDYDHDSRYMAFYPGVYTHAEAIPIEMKPGVKLPDVKFTTFYERLYTIRIRVVSSKGQVSYKNGCAVAVDSPENNPLSYHISHTLEEDGTYTFGYVPPGKYIVTTYFEPDLKGGQAKPFPEASQWKSARQDVIVAGDTEVTVRLEPAITKP